MPATSIVSVTDLPLKAAANASAPSRIIWRDRLRCGRSTWRHTASTTASSLSETQSARHSSARTSAHPMSEALVITAMGKPSDRSSSISRPR